MAAVRRAQPGWTTWPDVRAALRSRWEKGDLLRAVVTGRPVAPLELPLRGPSARELADQFGAVQDWVAGWRAARLGPARLETAALGGRLIGANQVPRRVVLDSAADVWTSLGVAADVARFDDLVAATGAELPAGLGWVAAHPHEALALAPEWDRILSVVGWILRRGGPAVYLRQVDVPGVDTKFIEHHRTVMGALLDRVLPAERIDPTAPARDLVRRYGLRAKPDLVRFRSFAPEDGPYSELAVRVEDLARFPFAARSVVVVENEVTYLAFPRVPGAVVVLGGGYAVSRLAALPWLADRDVVYWGDLDTHGFRALDRLRRIVPAVRSILMDTETLLAHRPHWSREPVPTTDHLPLLTPGEQAVYRSLLAGEHGEQVRLEQERIRFSTVERAALTAFRAVPRRCGDEGARP
ncbi:hypothetical protein DQ238_11355 [Geodermatophilus sp. TF02-6]|uniref:Wadjet anti-phage system protein JetD domain-containing protein n=1 Tax=Geodermatophilus sp. TF02-6 TaxID=2250575 RepID=UPI000DEA7F3D|nr:Wadjet anti-phage system protein JetD domain-containing protein [Geodermatophilus sp. TF02-6]RBY78965.1 hypothetical protein DQ238_11355 [Geodermatophilus sp. TF02-6]